GSMNAQDYASAKSIYQEASGLKPTESYPKSQITKIEGILKEQSRLASEQQALDEKYTGLIAQADGSMNAQDYASAKSTYQEASGLKPSEAYPKAQIVKIEGILAEQARLTSEQQALDEKYTGLIAQADGSMKAQDYASAKSSYQEASGLKPAEAYPRKRLDEIDEILKEREVEKANQLALDRDYNKAIDRGDEFMKRIKYSDAKVAYEEALRIKPSEDYPADKMEEIKQLLEQIASKNAEKEAIEVKYKTTLDRADGLFESKKYSEAKESYKEALEIKPREVHPDRQIKRIERILEVLNQEKAKREEKERKFNKAMENGELYLARGEMAVARHHFKVAIEVMPEKELPRRRLEEIDQIVAEKQRAENEENALAQKNDTKTKNDLEKDQKYLDCIENGDKAFANRQWGVAKFYFKKAQLLKGDEDYPAKQLLAIEKANVLDKIDQKESVFHTTLLRGDEEFEKKNYSVAKHYYRRALSMKKGENYPLKQIEKIDQLIRNSKDSKLNARYTAEIKKGDEAFEKGNWSVARFYYKRAKQLKPNETYPEEKLKAIREVLAKN
ncbi:MAG: hypothetical protein ACEPOZ_21770, partial [Marinifilaceae bacterium]